MTWWEILAVLGVATIASVTVITLKVLAFIENSDADAEKRHTEKLARKARDLELSDHPIDFKEADRLRTEISKRISAETLAKIARADKFEESAAKLEKQAGDAEIEGRFVLQEAYNSDAQELRRRAMKLRKEAM